MCRFLHQHVPFARQIFSFLQPGFHSLKRVNQGSVTKLKMFSGYFDFHSNNALFFFKKNRRLKKNHVRKFNALEQDKHGIFSDINYGFGNLLKGLM